MKICLLGPALTAVSGVSTHLNQLFSSQLAQRYELLHFQVGRKVRQVLVLSKVRHSLRSLDVHKRTL